ncbi:hypothetical protein BX600DRAFT_441690 [Xylariales sp. PMI_506]|nr:hypothetical protein BX600DRAFT_441690 [Xylariales sp. PMI_506]
MNHAKWSPEAAALTVEKPRVIVGLNGLYDMPSLIKHPGLDHQRLTSLYESFTRMAFGDDERLWEIISPVSVQNWASEWPEGKRVVLTQSKEGSLVPYNQPERMMARLNESKADSLEGLSKI